MNEKNHYPIYFNFKTTDANKPFKNFNRKYKEQINDPDERFLKKYNEKLTNNRKNQIYLLLHYYHFNNLKKLHKNKFYVSIISVKLPTKMN